MSVGFNGVRKPFSFQRMREAADAMEGNHNFEVIHFDFELTRLIGVTEKKPWQ